MPPLTVEQAGALRHLAALDTDWVKRIDLDGKASGVFADYRYVGTGDTGGAAQESTIKLLEAIATKSEIILPSLPKLNGAPAFPVHSVTVRVGEGPVHVVESSDDQMFKAITPEIAAHMPRYEGDLELTDHSAGSLTSQAYHKRWIIRDENLADAAEKASIAAQWLGARAYPQQRLNDAWMLAFAGHFHDTGAGTSTPRAYQYAWNDDVIAANQFAAVATASTTDDQKALFRVGNHTVMLSIQSWTGWIGQWDTRIWKNTPDRDWAVSANHAAWPPLNSQSEFKPPSWRYPDD
jgi:alpha-mannosidase